TPFSVNRHPTKAADEYPYMVLNAKKLPQGRDVDGDWEITTSARQYNGAGGYSSEDAVGFGLCFGDRAKGHFFPTKPGVRLAGIPNYMVWTAELWRHNSL